MRTDNRVLHSLSPGVLGHWPASVAATFLLALPALAEQQVQVDPREYVLEMRRVAARKPFLTDSPDAYLEPKSLNRFFTERIYKKLRGNAYVGYDYDEGFLLQGNTVQLEVLKDLTTEGSCKAAFRLALEQSFNAAGFEIKTTAPHQVGICIVGVEPRETPSTLAGIMVEAYIRNNIRRKSLFIRYGAGHPRGLATAIRLSAEMLVSQIISRTSIAQRTDEKSRSFNTR
jgi:hypothetical protein